MEGNNNSGVLRKPCCRFDTVGMPIGITRHAEILRNSFMVGYFKPKNIRFKGSNRLERRKGKEETFTILMFLS